jgi:uncharacterized protein YcaQ
MTAAQARRVALAAQGFGARGPAAGQQGRVDKRGLRKFFDTTHVLQIDSVNVLSRAHYLPPYSRLGSYDRDRLDDFAYRDRAVFEYWGHMASFVPVAMHPLFRWRMRRAEEQFETWGGIARLAKARPGYIEHIYAAVKESGPLTAGELAEEEVRVKEDWGWNWSDAKTALEFLFWSGRIATVKRVKFERVYDIAERVIPAEVFNAPTPSEEEAHRQLLRLSADACGVGTVGDLADYFRIKVPQARPRIAELVESGELVEVAVDGWPQPAYVRPGVRVPRKVDAVALLAPFDPLVWERARTERIFDFHYRIEIYVPAAKRVHGYYVLPFLLGDALVARVDLKSDRSARVLLVQAAYAEPDAPAHTAEALAAELRRLAAWLDLDDVVVRRRGDLARPLAAALS